jgi:hypothetical protein
LVDLKLLGFEPSFAEYLLSFAWVAKKKIPKTKQAIPDSERM